MANTPITPLKDKGPAPLETKHNESFGEKARDVKDAAFEKAGEIKDSLTEKAGNLTDKAKDAAGNVADKASEMAAAMSKSASAAATAVGDKVDEGVKGVACGMKSLAGTIRENAPAEGMLRQASTTVADSLESGGRYLQEEGLSGMADDLTAVIRKNPIPAVLIGIGIGFLVARATSSSRS